MPPNLSEIPGQVEKLHGVLREMGSEVKEIKRQVKVLTQLLLNVQKEMAKESGDAPPE